MKRVVVIFLVCIFVLIGNILSYFKDNYFNSKQSAITALIKKEVPNLIKRDYRIIEVPNSSYLIYLTDIPHRLYVFETTKHFYQYKASLLTVENLYAGDGTGVHYVNGKFVYGFDKEKPKDKDIYINNKKMNVLPMGKYFKDSKYEMIYRNLVLYYPSKPMGMKNSTNSSIGFDEKIYR